MIKCLSFNKYWNLTNYVTKFSKRDLAHIELLILTLTIWPFCTGSEQILVSKKLNDSSSWLPNLMDFLCEMLEYEVIKSKHLKNGTNKCALNWWITCVIYCDIENE